MKIHDDESKLKKAANRKEKTKAKSKKTWYVVDPLSRSTNSFITNSLTYSFCRDERKDQVSASMAAKQKKRADNIAMRNERRNDKRKGVKTKDKGRPGFEGKSFGKGKGHSKGKAPSKK